MSIPQELKKTDLVYEADEIAFVCPDYAGAIPKIVREFVSKGTFKAPYIFSVITYVLCKLTCTAAFRLIL